MCLIQTQTAGGTGYTSILDTVMNCSHHPEISAVAQCGICGMGICIDCANNSEYRSDNKALCRNCNYSMIKAAIDEGISTHTKTKIKIIINAICIVLGIIVFFQSPETGIILFAIGGIPTAWKIFKTNAEERMQNKIDDAVMDVKHGVGSSLMSSAIRFIIRITLTVVVGAIASPILLIVNIVKLPKIKKEIEENQFLLANFA